MNVQKKTILIYGLVVLLLLSSMVVGFAEELTPVTSLDVGMEEVNINISCSTMVPTLCLPKSATNKTLQWSTSNSKIAEVSETGNITGLSEGECVVTCETTDGSELKQEIQVIVTHKYAVLLKDVKVTFNSINIPEVSLSVENIGKEESIIAYSFATKCYNAYDLELKPHGFGDAIQYWIWQEGKIKPGKSTSANDNWCWTLHGIDTAYTIDVWLTDYRTSDGNIVTIPEADWDVHTWQKQ